MDKKTNYIKNYYNEHAQRWINKDLNSFYHETPFKKFEKLLKAKDLVLDIGCAGGIHVPLFMGIGRKLNYIGLDISKNMIKIAKQRYPQLKFYANDLSNFKTKKKFNGFWASAILMHLPNKELDKTLNNLEKICKPKTIGYISLPNKRPNEANPNDQRHFTLYNINDFKSLAKKRNWKIIKTGKLYNKNGESIWNWYIVKINNKNL